MKKSVFQRINRESVAEQVFESLKDSIEEGQYKAGDKLPSETSLANTFGVSRLSVRTAIQKLSLLGLADVKVGEGTFVKEMSFLNLTNQVSEMIANEDMMEYLLEFRTNIESHCTNLALKRATDQELDELLKLSYELGKIALESNIEKYTELDYEFHYMLCKLSKNKLYELVYSSIRDLFYKTIRMNLESISDVNFSLKNSAEGHISLVLMLKERNELEALSCIDKIINNFVETGEAYSAPKKYSVDLNKLDLSKG